MGVWPVGISGAGPLSLVRWDLCRHPVLTPFLPGGVERVNEVGGLAGAPVQTLPVAGGHRVWVEVT